MDSVEIRGPVYDGANFAAIFATDGVNDTGDFDYYLEMNSTTFAGFYYDLDTGASTEVLRIYNTTTNGAVTVATGKVLDEDAIEYNTTITAVEYEFGDTGDAWDGTTYNVIGIFAEEFIPLTATTPDKVAKLLVDSDDKTTLRTGQALELGGGYAITAQQVDVEGNKVWLELTKDGEFVEDEIVDLTGAAGAGANWTYTPDIEDEDNVEVMKVFVSDVFQGQVDSLAVIEAVWLMAFDDVRIIEDDDKFGVFEVAVGTSSLVFTNPNSITLSENTVKDLAEGMSFKVADDVGTDLRFYLMKEHTEPGTYEVRGTVVEDAGSTWTAADFAGFYYNLDDDVSTETLTISGISNNDRSIEEDELSYNTSIQSVGFEFGDAGDAWAADTYDVIAIFAEEFIPLTAT
ncbi:MAG: PGF-CTERM sorting domain-containing protein, partial [Zetaproteobacteria bacterium]|nr:PGF-CTERM sorting domain-containing protein [Zetaproteobacteria bacterium]